MATNSRNDPMPAQTDWWKVAYKQQQKKKQQQKQAGKTPINADDWWAYSFDKKRFGSINKAPKFSIDEAMTLSKNRYTGLFQVGAKETVGLLGSPWQQTAALYRLRKGYRVPGLIYTPQNKREVLDMAAAKPITFGGRLYTQITDLQDRFESKYGAKGERYVAQYGNLPSTSSKYGILFNLNNPKIRRDAAMSTYQNILAEQARNIGRDLMNADTGDETKNATLAARGMELLAIGQEYRSKEGRWSDTRISELSSVLGTVEDSERWSPNIEKAMGVKAPTQTSYGATAAATMLAGPFAGLFTSSDSGQEKAQSALQKIAAVTEASILSPELIDSEDNPIDIVGKLFANSAKGLARIGIGFPVGVAAVVDNLAETGENILSGDFKTDENTWNGIDTTMLNAIKEDYVKRYKTPFDGGLTSVSSWKKFGQELAADPTMPVLDVLSVVPVVGWIAKGAGVAATAGRVGKFGKFADLTPEAQARYNRAEATLAKVEGKPTEATWVRTDRAAVAEAIDVVDTIDAARTQISARRYNRLARKAIAGDVSAETALEGYRARGLIIPDGKDSLLIRAGAKFEPKIAVLETPRKIADIGDSEIVYRRLPASPLARAGSNTLSWLAKSIDKKSVPPGEEATAASRIAEVITEFPGIGYRWQYSRAQKSVLTADMHDTLTSFATLSTHYMRTAAEANISAGMERAILSELTGGTGQFALDNPAFQRAILEGDLDEINSKIERKELNPADEDVINRIKALEARRDALPTPDEYESARARLRARLNDPDAFANDKELDLAVRLYERGQQLERRKNRIVTEETDVVTLSYLRQLYAEAISALKISGEALFGKNGALEGLEDRVVGLTPNYPIHEMGFGGTNSWLNVVDPDTGRSVFDKIEDAGERQRMIDEFKRALRALREDGVFRGAEGTSLSDGNPMVILADSVRGYGRNDAFIAFHRLRLDGTIEAGTVKPATVFKPDEVYYFPREMFFKPESKLSKADAQDLVETGALNAMSEYFPNAKFYSDKVNESGLTGETTNFTDAKTESIVATNGLKAHTLRMYAQSQINYAKNRYNRDIGDLVASNAELIPLSVANARKGDYRILKNIRVFSDRAEAERFARDRGVLRDFVEGVEKFDTLAALDSPFDLDAGFGKIRRNGEDLYVVQGDIRDWSIIVQREEAAKLRNTSEYQRALYDNLESIPASNGTFVLAVPKTTDRMIQRMVNEGNSLADEWLNKPLIKGPTNVFKRLVLNFNPRFIGTNVVGGLAMMMIYNPLIASKILTRAIQAAARNSNTEAWYNIVRDGNVLEYHLAYELEKNIYRQELGRRSIQDIGMAGKAAKYGWNGGYTTVAAFEKFVRKAVAKDFLDRDEVFRAFMDGPEVDNYIRRGVDFQGNRTTDITRFEAAADLLLDPVSPYYNPMLKYRMRYTTNTVSGNYHSFGPAEQVMRNLLMPFYAWQRHSLAFTWRLPIDRPITAAVIGNLGGYGYNVALNAGLPEWMYQTVPMPEFMKEALGLEGEDYRIDLGAISPFGTTGDMALAATNLLTGEKTGSTFLNFTNPYVNEAIETMTGVDSFTGRQVYERKGVFEGLKDAAGSMPGIKIPKSVVWDSLSRAYEDDALGNRYRTIDNAEDIVKNYDPGKRFADWELSIPEQSPQVRSASWNDEVLKSFFPLKIYEPNVVRMSELAQKEAIGAAILRGEQANYEKDKASKMVDSVSKWRRKRDFVLSVWLPAAESQGVDPAMIELVLAKLQDERPKSVKAASFERILQALGG